MGKTIFRSSSLERISSPEQLNDYMRVSNPRIWIVLAAAAVLLVSFLIWGIFGELPTTVSASGIVKDGVAVCYVPRDAAGDISVGDLAVVNKIAYKVSDIGSVPLSKAEVDADCGSDYVRSMLKLEEWNVKITIEATDAADGFAEIIITTEYISPISFLIN